MWELPYEIFETSTSSGLQSYMHYVKCYWHQTGPTTGRSMAAFPSWQKTLVWFSYHYLFYKAKEILYGSVTITCKNHNLVCKIQ
jgi:hypothetical protein